MSFLSAASTILSTTWDMMESTTVPGFSSLSFAQLFCSILLIRVGFMVMRMFFGNGAPERGESVTKTTVFEANKAPRERITVSKKL